MNKEELRDILGSIVAADPSAKIEDDTVKARVKQLLEKLSLTNSALTH